MGLAVHDQRIDAAPDGRVPSDHHRAGVGIDPLADRAAIEKTGRASVVGYHRDAVRGRRGACSGGCLREFEKVEAAVGLARSEAAVIGEVDAVWRHVQDHRRDFALRDQVVVAIEKWSRHGARTARMRAAADLHHIGVAEMIFTASAGTWSRSETTWAKLVSCPCPLDCVPMTTSTRPSCRTVMRACSLGAPIEDST